ncbi:MAG TPA: isoprenylcysteine carboxylmethyltransferase family protein [Aggregicoccus sp.]|nr:isoprenylcysteine carboxylmethyltransferase family protein [Aggregicoccus sp.]
MRRPLILAFGVACYGIFFLTFLYLIAFVGNLQTTALAAAVPALREWVPWSVDAGRAGTPLWVALAVDVGLISLFGLQHSAMARSGFKAWLTRHVPTSVERSVYVLAASAALALLLWQWRPLPEPVLWRAGSGLPAALAWTGFVAGFGLVLASTFLINHFNLFGLQQVWMQFVGRTHQEPSFRTPLLYRFVRHPLYLGFLIAFWSTPTMTLGHLVFALGMSGYILVGASFEERDLERVHGERYRRYRAQVPRFLPRPGHPWTGEGAAAHPAPLPRGRRLWRRQARA